MSSSKPTHLPKALPLNTILLEVRISTSEIWGSLTLIYAREYIFSLFLYGGWK